MDTRLRGKDMMINKQYVVFKRHSKNVSPAEAGVHEYKNLF